MIAAPIVTLAQGATGAASKVAALEYPALARAARVIGDVTLRSGPDGVTQVNLRDNTVNRLLASTALENLKSLGKLSDAEVEVIYHFVLVRPEYRAAKRTVKKGNRFERFFLRALMLKTEKVEDVTECVAAERPPNRIDVGNNPVEVWVYGALPCMMFEAVN
jgi:hypothetical protein